MVLFTSDTHYSHANIVHYCHRPFKDVEQMNEAMVKNWNDRVQPCDTVYHLGDFALGQSGNVAKWRARLNGKIVLILGNHDRSRKHMLEAGIDEVYQEWRLDGDIPLYLRHRPPYTDEWTKKSFYFLHGHVHNSYTRRGNVINVGVDVRGFKPVSLAELLT